MKVKLFGDEKKALKKRYTENAESHNLFLLGRYHQNKRTEKELKKAIDYYTQALEKDHHFALAYTGMADSYNLLGFYDLMPPKDVFPKAKEAAEKALQLDNSLAEAHNSLAVTNLYWNWNWSDTEKGFKKAISLNPGLCYAHFQHAIYLMIFRRFDEALMGFKKSQELDPLFLSANWLISNVYRCLGKHDEAMEQCQMVLETAPDFGLIYGEIGAIYREMGKYDEAIKAIKKGLELTGKHPWLLLFLGYTYGIAGKREEAENMIDMLKEIKKEKYVPSAIIADIYLGLGDNDKSLEWLDKAYNERVPNLPYINFMPELDPLRSDPRFKALLKKMGLPE